MELGRATVVDSLGSLELAVAHGPASAVYDRPIELRLLLADPLSGEEHYVVRYPAALKARMHRHSAAHTIVVLEGSLEANGHVIGPGSYAHFPAGESMRHQTAGDAPCLFVILFHDPFDVEIAPFALHEPYTVH